jgi:two-component system, NtrC family, response regulator GlrR
MNRVRALVLESETTEEQGRVLQRLLDSSSELAFQIERSSLKTLQQDSPSSATSTFSPEVIIIFVPGNDVLPETDTVFSAVKQKFPDVPILGVIEADDSRIFNLLEIGVDDFVVSPIKPGEILLRIKRLVEKNALEDSISQSVKQKFGLKQMIGESAAFLSEIKKIPLLAKSDAIVLITGETGTGKELCARAIHYLSPRSRAPFMPINCGAIPVDLVENELFGHEKGAFTGASESRTGLIAEAEGGTVFLDEIDCLPLAAQVKLLRFLQEKEYRPLGSKKMKKADVRLLAAMNVDPQEAIAAGRLRQDLYYRLNVIPLVIPPLRERREDIALLAHHFLLKYAVQFNKPMADFSEEAMQLLQLYDWPGNVRELEHNVERAVVLTEGRMIQAKDVVLPSSESDLQESFHDAKMKMTAVFEKTYIERLLLAHHGNISQAARAAQKNRRAFWELIRKYQIDVENFKI